MKFIILGSSSSGNGYLLQSSIGETLVIEAGIKLLEVKKTIDFDLSKIVGCIVSHSHADHSFRLNSYQMAGIWCYMNDLTKQKRFGEHLYYNVTILKENEQRTIGSFLIKPFRLEHDVENFGYLIHHHEMGLCCFITDTQYCPYRFKGLNNILIEANYSDAIVNKKLLKGDGNMFVRNRVLTSHMELETTKGFLKANDLNKVNNIILLHLSDGNSNASLFKKEIQELTGKTVHVAQRGLNVELNKTAF